MMSFLTKSLGVLLALAVFAFAAFSLQLKSVGLGIAAECHAGDVRALIAGPRQIPKITPV